MQNLSLSDILDGMIAKKHQKNTHKYHKITTHPIPSAKRVGKILFDSPHRREAHEKETAALLIRWGYDLMFIKAKNIPHTYTPDCAWRGNFWELKALFEDTTEAINSDMRKASKQADYIVIDACRIRRTIGQVARSIINYYQERYRGKKNKTILILGRGKKGLLEYCIIDSDMLK